MKVNAARFRRYARRVFEKPAKNIAEAAVRTEELSSRISLPVEKARFLAEDINKIQSASPWRSLEKELEILDADEITFEPFNAFHLEAARIVEGYIYVGSSAYQYGVGKESWRRQSGSRVHSLESATLTTTYSGSHFFGCFLHDDLLHEELGYGTQNITLPTKDFWHEEGYRNLFQLPKPPIITDGLVRDLVVFDPPPFSLKQKELYSAIRRRLSDSRSFETHPGVYLRRKDTGEARLLVNEQELEQKLQELGFKVIDPIEMEPSRIVQETLGAEVVIGVEGSQLAHGIFTINDEGTFLVLQPPTRFALPYKEICDLLDCQYAFTVCDIAPSNAFKVDIDKVIELLPNLH